MRHFCDRKIAEGGIYQFFRNKFLPNRKDIYGTPERAEERDGQQYTTIDAFLAVFLFDSTQGVNYTFL